MCRGLETDLAKNQRRSDLGTERNTPARNYKIFFDEKEWGQQFMFASTIPFWKESIGSRLNVRSSCCLNCFWGVDSGVLRERDKNIGWSLIGEKPNLSRGRILGSKFSSSLQSKYEESGQEGVLLGHHGNVIGYRVMDQWKRPWLVGRRRSTIRAKEELLWRKLK